MKIAIRASAAAVALGISTAGVLAEPLKIQGTVSDVVGHRVVVESADGKILVDLGPEADGQTALKVGDKITVDGDMKPGDQLHAESVTLASGQVYELHKKKGWLEWLTGKSTAELAPITIDQAKKFASAKGYTLTSEPVAEKKHFVANATKDGKTFSIDIHADGSIVANEPFGVAEAKKLALEKGYTLTSEPVPEKKHFKATGTKDGKTYELDLHRDGNVVEKIAFSPADAKKLVVEKGYEVIGDGKPDHEHFQFLGKKDGKFFAIDAHRDGTVKEVRTVDKTDIKWGPLIQ